eukprot:3049011-Rhodomonas_salina.1
MFMLKIKDFVNHLDCVTMEIMTSNECMFKFQCKGDLLCFIVTDDRKLTFFLGVGYDWLEDGSLMASQTAYIN